MPNQFDLEEFESLRQDYHNAAIPRSRPSSFDEFERERRIYYELEPLPPPAPIPQYEQPKPEAPGWREYIGEAAQAVPRGALGFVGSAMSGAAQNVRDIASFAGMDPDVLEIVRMAGMPSPKSVIESGEAVKGLAESIPVTPGFEDSWTRAIGEGGGTALAGGAAYALGGPLALAGTSGSAAYDNTRKMVKDMGGTDAQAANYAGLTAAVTAATEPFGAIAKGFKIFKRLDKATNGYIEKYAAKEAIKDIAGAGGAEFVQEFSQGVPDEIARHAFQEERTLIDSLASLFEQGVVGGVVGTLFGGMATAIKVVVDRGNQRIIEDYKQRVEAGQSDPVPNKEVFKEAGFSDMTRKERAAEVQTILKEQQDAVIQGQVEQGREQQRPQAEEGGLPAEAGRGDLTQQGGQVEAQGQIDAVLEPKRLHDAEKRFIESQAAYDTARKAVESYKRQRGYKANADPELLKADVTYQSFKAVADAAKRSLSSAEGARTRAMRSQRDEPTTPEEIAVQKPLHEIPEQVARTMQEEAQYQITQAKSEKTKAALQRIIDDAGRDVGAAVEKQKQRLLDILSGKIDQRSIYEKQFGDPRPPDETIEAYKAGEPLPPDTSFPFGAMTPPQAAVQRPGLFGQETFDAVTGRQGELPMAPRAESNLPDAQGQMTMGDAQGIGPNLVGVEVVDKLMRSGKRAISAVRSAFRARGNLPAEAAAIKQDSEHALKAMQKEIRFAEDDLRQAVKAELGTGKLTERGESVLDRALRDVDFAQTLPPRTRAAITKMRALADSYSRRIRETVPMSEKLQEAIAANEGVYLRRTYKAHNDPEWMDKVPQFVRDEFKQQLIDAYPEYNNNQLDALINKLLYDAKEASNPLAFWAGAKLGHKDLTGLMRRKDLSEAFRKLLGEEKDPFVNFVRTTLYQSKLVANQKMLSELRDAGLGKWFFEQGDPNIDPRAMAEIAIPGDRTMNPLDGLVTYPEIASELAKHFHPREIGKLGQWYYRALFAAKTAKTVLSHTSIIRNAISNPLLLIRNGHWKFWQVKDPLRAVFADLGWDKTPPSREYLLDLQRRGVWDESTTAQELRLIARGALGKTIDEAIGGPERTAIRKAKDIGVKLWQVGDNVYRAWFFEAEKARYKKAMPGLSEEQLADLAAKRTNQLMPSASMIPKGVRAMQRLPAVETFIGFHAEIIRTSYNTIKLTMQELASPHSAIKAIGAQRLVGMLVAAGMLEGLKEGIYRLFGINRKNEKDVERMLYGYQENNPVMLLSNPANGKVQYIDLAFTDPQSVLRTPVIAAIRGDNWEDSFWQSAKQFGGTFLGENIMTEMLVDIARNRDRDGFAIWNKQDTLPNKLTAIFKRAGEPFVPGSAVSLNRLRKAYAGTIDPSGRSYDPEVETLGQFGFRAQELDIRQRISQKAREFHEATTEAAGVYRKFLTQRGPVNDADILASREQTEAARKVLFDHMHEDAMSAIRLGVPVEEVKAALRAGGVSKEDASEIVNGKYEPYKPSKQMERNFKKRIEAVPKEGSTGLDEYRRRAKLTAP